MKDDITVLENVGLKMQDQNFMIKTQDRKMRDRKMPD